MCLSHIRGGQRTTPVACFLGKQCLCVGSWFVISIAKRQTNIFGAYKVRATSPILSVKQSLFASSQCIGGHIARSVSVSYVLSGETSNTMSDATPPARSWTLPAWVEERISEHNECLKGIPEYPLEAFDTARPRTTPSNLRRLIKLRKAAEIQSHWLESELDRLKREKNMLIQAEDPYTDEQQSLLLDEQQEKFFNIFLVDYTNETNEKMEQRREADNAIREIKF